MTAAVLIKAAHLTRRFFGSLWPIRLKREDADWAAEHLLASEQELWALMSDSDRRHAISVARRVSAALGLRADRPVLAAALLHDVGKAASELGILGRVVATLAGLVARDRAQAWSSATGIKRRIALYLSHPELGAGQLARAGSDPLTVAWAREHHLPEGAWSVPWEVSNALRAADQG
jgi:hypothetical protein